MLSCGLAGGGISFEVAQSAVTEPIVVTAAQPVMLSTPEIEEVVEETFDISGFELNVLCDTIAAESFGAEEEGTSSLSALAHERNLAFEAETGASLNVIRTDYFYQSAHNDILSGAYEYNLYAASAADSLSPLLSSGLLHDVSGSKHIDTSLEWIDGATMDALSLNGGQYLISSAAADAHMNAYAIAYDRDIAYVPDGMKTHAASVADGSFTVGQMLEYCRAAYKEGTAEAGATYGFGVGDDDIMPLYFGVGGDFVRVLNGALQAASLDTVNARLDELNRFIVEDGGAVIYNSEGNAAFSLTRLCEIPKLRDAGINVGILPLPKLADTDSYSTYIDLSGAVMMAMPFGVPEHEKVEYSVDYISELSLGYISPYYRNAITADDAGDEKSLEIILGDTSNDLSSLFGYGEVGKLFADEASGNEDRFEYEYYNRCALYEEAITIIEKRIAANKDNIN